MTANFRPGDTVVDLRVAAMSHRTDQAGSAVTVERVTQTMVITSDGERYNRKTAKPISEGRYSTRELVMAHDPRVVAVRARTELATIARIAQNLTDAHRDSSAEVVTGALAGLLGQVDTARRDVIEMMRQATEAKR